MAIATFSLDPNAAALEDAAFSIRNETGGALAAGDLVFISSWSEAQARPLVTKADANVPGAQAVFVMRGSLADVTDGEAFRTFRTGADQNTGAGAVGDPVFLSETEGLFTITAPSASGSVRQVVGRVAVVDGSIGVIEYDIVNSLLERVGSNELQDAAVEAAKIAAAAVGNTELAATAAKDNLDALSDTARTYVKTNPVAGEFPIVAIQRQADGKLDAEYDDVPIV